MSFRTAVLAVLLAAAAAAAQAGPTQPGAVPLPKDKPHRPVGINALAVHPGGVNFSKKDVAAYVLSHNLPRNQGKASDLEVVSLEFITIDELRARVAIDTTGFDGGEPIGLATLIGPLAFGGPQGTSPFTASKGYVVFDAGTGNLLLLGTLPD